MRSNPKFEILFYVDRHEKSSLLEWLHALQVGSKIKNNRVLLAKIRHLFSLLEQHGPRLTMPECRKLVSVVNPPLWELRILTINHYRIFWTLWQGDVLILHWMRKDTAKTPKLDILKAQTHYKDWINRHGR